MSTGDKTNAIEINGRPIIQGRGLTSPGIVVLYVLGLLFVQTLENFISGQPGRITGIVLLALFFGAVKLGRRGTLFTAVVTPPLALSATLLVATVISKGFGLTGLLVGIVSNLARPTLQPPTPPTRRSRAKISKTRVSCSFRWSWVP